MDFPFSTVCDQGGDYTARDGSFNVDESNFIDQFQQQQSFASQESPSMPRPRHDSVNSLGCSQVPQLPAQHQAEHQPFVQRLTPHGAPCSIQSADMSRVTSHASYRSSTSSGQQRGGEAHLLQRHLCSHSPLPSWADMRRTRTTYSPRPPLFSHQTNSQWNTPPMYPPLANPYAATPSNGLVIHTSAAQHGTTPFTLDNAIINYDLSGLNRADHFEDGVFDYE